MKFLIAFAFLAILGSLGTALYFMMQDGRNGKAKSSKMAWALAMRVGLSIVLFLCILIAWKLGYVNPTGIPAGQ